MTKLGEKLYSPAKASELIGGIWGPETLKKYAYEDKIPHHGGRGKGNICFSASHLQAILDMTETKPEETKQMTKHFLGAEVELSDLFRQTSRSRALHRKAAA